MSVKEIENISAMKANATRGNVYIQYTLTNTSNTFQINQQQQACRTDKCKNAHIRGLPFILRDLVTLVLQSAN